MKLIEKKCPNCGADLEFNQDDREVTCKYCHTSYEIQNDADLNALVNRVFDANDFILHKKMIKNYSKGVMIFSIIIFLFIFIVFLIMFFNIFPRVIR